MSYRCNQRIKERGGYTSSEETEAYRTGYNDGFAALKNGANKAVADEWPNAYSAGYWDGWHDGGQKREPGTIARLK